MTEPMELERKVALLTGAGQRLLFFLGQALPVQASGSAS